MNEMLSDHLVSQFWNEFIFLTCLNQRKLEKLPLWSHLINSSPTQKLN